MFLAVLTLAATVSAQQWERFRGPNGTGISTDAQLPAKLDPARNMVWKIGSAEGSSSPVAADGKLFLIDTSGRVTVVRAGAQWAESSTSTLGEPCFATPAIAGRRIYVRTAKTLVCFANKQEE